MLEEVESRSQSSRRHSTPSPSPTTSSDSSIRTPRASISTSPIPWSRSDTPTLEIDTGKGAVQMVSSQPSSPGGTIRRASVRRPIDLRVDTIAGSSKDAAGSRRVSDDDTGLMMRERGERSERDEGSVGRSGGVDVHVGGTRPKRRLSSLPSLPHPFYNSNPDHRALSTSSPPASPGGRYASSSNSTYQVLANGIGATGSGGSQTQNPYSYPYNGHNVLRMNEKMEERASMVRDGKGETSSPRLFGIELKWISLLTLALQNAFLTIIMHYSRITASPNKTYSAASAVLLNELLKGSISVFIALRNIDISMSNTSHPLSAEKPIRTQLNRPSILSSRFSMFYPSRLHALRIAIFSPDCIQLSIPAILYVIQNNLQYTAASNLDVATFQVTYQMKILTTAAFSVLMLRRKLSRTKWLALFLLAIGVGIVQIQSSSAPSLPKPQHSTRSDLPEVAEEIVTALHTMSPLKGFLAVTAACMTSGLAGVYFELLLKSSSSSGSGGSGSGGGGSQPDLWVRNTQLSLFSLVPAVVPILFNGSSDGLGPIGRLLAAFTNFNGWAIGTVLTQTFGGLITAIVIRYSDNIMKGFATSLSIIISFLASVALFNYPITFAFVLGSSVVLAATIMYNLPSSPTPSTRREMANPPGSPIHSSAPILGEPEKPSRGNSVISLLGLLGPSRPASRTPSRAPSGENLRHMSSLSSLGPGFQPQHSNSSSTSSSTSGMNQFQQNINQNHVYAASAPGTPYIKGSTEGNNHGYMNIHHAEPTQIHPGQGRISPNMIPLPPRLRSPLPPNGYPNTSTPAYGPGSGLGGAKGLQGQIRKDSLSGESNTSSSSSGVSSLGIGKRD